MTDEKKGVVIRVDFARGQLTIDEWFAAWAQAGLSPRFLAAQRELAGLYEECPLEFVRLEYARPRWREDGWPICIWCGEDELYSLAMPATAEQIDGCYRCGVRFNTPLDMRRGLELVTNEPRRNEPRSWSW